MRHAIHTLVVGLVFLGSVSAQPLCAPERVSFFYAVEPCADAPAPVPPPPPPAPQPYPLFTPQTVAPHTPPLMLEFLQQPTLDNALRYEAWDAQRQAQIQAVLYWREIARRVLHGQP